MRAVQDFAFAGYPSGVSLERPNRKVRSFCVWGYWDWNYWTMSMSLPVNT